MDRVQVVKQESPSEGGTDVDAFAPRSKIEPQEDALEAAGLYIQDDLNRDETTLISRSGNDMTFKDVNNPTAKTLTELLSGSGGVTEASHKALRDLIHFAEGPADGFASGAFEEILPTADPFPTSAIWYTDSGKTSKIVSLEVTYNANKTINTETWKMYDTDGSTVLVTMVDTHVYSGIFLSNTTRTWS
jgi:hypothetical protein